MEKKPWTPQWLNSSLIEDRFPWSASQKLDLSAFLTANALHDSRWIVLAMSIHRARAVAVFYFDWIEFTGNAPFREETIDRWPLLLIRLSPLLKVVLNIGVPAGEVMRAATRPVTRREYRSLKADAPQAATLPESSISRTDIEDDYGGVISLYHGSTAEVLCMSYDGQVVALPECGGGLSGQGRAGGSTL